MSFQTKLWETQKDVLKNVSVVCVHTIKVQSCLDHSILQNIREESDTGLERHEYE